MLLLLRLCRCSRHCHVRLTHYAQRETWRAKGPCVVLCVASKIIAIYPALLMSSHRTSRQVDVRHVVDADHAWAAYEGGCGSHPYVLHTILRTPGTTT